MRPDCRATARPRRLGVGLILLALWLQMLAPLGDLLAQARAAGAAAGDGGHTILCGPRADRDDRADATADVPAAACARCPLCRCTAATPVRAAPELAVRTLRWRPVTWPIPPPTRVDRPPCLPGPARAPPRSV